MNRALNIQARSVLLSSVRRLLGRCLITHYQIPIKIGAVTIKPGDIIMGDIDGVLCVPRDIAWDVLLRAEEIRENEKKIFSWVNSGESIDSITKKGGYF